MGTTVTIIGSAAIEPEVEQETASFVLNGRYLVDTGWCVPMAMRRHGIQPNRIDVLFLTHCHHDHVMGLPALLFYRGMRLSAGIAPPPLRIYGPVEEMPEAVENARRFLRAGKFPEIWLKPELFPLSPGDEREEPEFEIRVERTSHGVPGLAYRFTDRSTGKVVAFTGDTGYKPDLANLAAGADLLIHEASYASPHPTKMGDSHSSAEDAARIAQVARVSRLALIHYARQNGPKSLEAARAIFPDTILTEEGLVLTI